MTQSILNADLSKMSYEQFQEFMRGLAQLYSDVNSNGNYMSLFKDLKTLAKHVERLPQDFFTFYGAYEIADNQVVVAVFRINLDAPMHSDTAPNMTIIEVSFAEDERNLQCPAQVREYLTQTDYVAQAEKAYPQIMEDLLWEKEREKRVAKLNLSEEDKRLLFEDAIEL
ncbi:hypothetical protein [Bergeriella denitrificans]|uniref:Uncharacterized protein n=1 Tax=Bergeriella denitrificans TaxID=494 RepID=A0A378UHN7_BERDE|nr:hypothetical protein [Bergeriella denitrificans]STZ76660.1 Uncharacterised protein [Bergeriella denitrificans]